MSRWLALAGFLILTLGTGALGALVTATSVRTWYPTLAKPPLNPPDWVFAPVWNALFVLMAVAAWRVWQTVPGPGRRVALVVFLLQLALNLGWSIAFFGLQRPAVALALLAALLFAVLANALLFNQRDRIAALLLLPYLAWLAFAGYLNLGIVRLNG